MNPPERFDLLQALNIQVVERTAPRVYVTDRVLPHGCFRSLFSVSVRDGRQEIDGVISSFLENFLIDAEIFWEQEDEGRINSGPWVETVSGHGECMFEAIAVRTGGRDYLLVQLSRHAYLEKQDFIQKGRQLSLQAGKQARREKDLVASKEELESLVQEQTQGLLDANRRLRQEMARREKLETQMRQASKMESLGTMAGGIAHDFNNILSAVMGYAELAQNLSDAGSAQRRYIEGVIQAAERARGLVAQILSFSRQAGGDRSPIQTREVIQEGLGMIRASLPTSIRIEARLESDSVILADATQIHQVLLNLGTNAGHAMALAGGTLFVALTDVELDDSFCQASVDLSPGRYQRLTVRDTGAGVPPDIAHRVFDPFFTTKGVGAGTGMGLAVVHGIVSRHGGAVLLDNPPGQGAAFHVYFPVADMGVERPPSMPQRLAGGAESILVVDDDPAIADIIQQSLASLGYRVVTRTASTDALALFREDPARFDLVITDLTMPHLSGDRLTGKIHALRKDVPVILCTGFDPGVDDRAEVYPGVAALLKKPVLRKDLATVVRRVLDHKGFG